MMKTKMKSLCTQAAMIKATVRKKRFVTIVEVLVVVALIVILASIWQFVPLRSSPQDRQDFFDRFLTQSKKAALLQKSDVELLFTLKDPQKGIWRIERRVALRPSPVHFFKEDLATGALPHTLVSPYRINQRAKNRLQMRRETVPISDNIELEGVSDFVYEREKNSSRIASWEQQATDRSQLTTYRMILHYRLDSSIPKVDLLLQNNDPKLSR